MKDIPTAPELSWVELDEKSPLLPDVKELYELSFPEEERLPFRSLLRLHSRAAFDFMVFLHGERFVGFICSLTLQNYCWGFYFTMVPEVRGHGLGAKALEAFLKRHAGHLVVIDIEHPFQPSELDGTAPQGLAPEPMRRRRNQFYQRHGFRDMGIRREYGGVTYQILAHGDGSITDEGYQQLINAMWALIKEDGGSE